MTEAEFQEIRKQLNPLLNACVEEIIYVYDQSALEADYETILSQAKLLYSSKRMQEVEFLMNSEAVSIVHEIEEGPNGQFNFIF